MDKLVDTTLGINVFIDTSGTTTKGLVKVWNGTAWVLATVSVWNGTTWSSLK